MTINILPQEVADQIAAGEVVERPASVVKELVENSLDAGSSFIEIDIEEGGVKKIEIRDDGMGMSPDDLEKSVLRHATSKIDSIDDIFSLHSFGFRGEALAAISAVSTCSITSRLQDSSEAMTLRVKNGKKEPLQPSGAPVGTTLLIEDLFESVPARKKYLKSERGEFRALYREVVSFALSNPSVGFVLRHNGNIIFEVGPMSPLERVESLLSIKDGWVKAENNVSTMKLSGFLSKPDKAQKTKNHQYLFVNGRHIEDRQIAFAIRDAYTQTCGLDKALHPPFVLFLDIDPLLVDANVHPRKTEVAFSDPRDVFRFVAQSVKNGLSEFGGQQMYNVPQSSFRAPLSHTPQKMSFTPSPSMPSFSERASQRDGAPCPVPDFKSVTSESPIPTSEELPEELRLVGQVANKYMVAENEEGLFIFDQHALHERIRFEMLVEQATQKSIDIQPLLIPQSISLPPDILSVLQEHTDVLVGLGIQVLVTDSAVEVQSIPQLLEQEPLDFLLQDMARYFEEEQTGEHTYERILRVVLEYKSCRGSVKFGDKLEPAEMKLLLQQYADLKHKLLCPHGRPNHVFWKFEDLDTSFYR